VPERYITLYTIGVEQLIGTLSTFLYKFQIFFCFSLVCYRDFFIALAYITGGKYVPMATSKHLEKVVIRGAHEEISLDRLMQNAMPDIDRKRQIPVAEGVDERVKVKRLNNMFSVVVKNSNRTKLMHFVARSMISSSSNFGMTLSVMSHDF
jgi:hypothetical protein